MKKSYEKIIISFLFCLNFMFAFGQSNTYFHDRIDTAKFVAVDTVGHGANNYFGTNLHPDFNVKQYVNGCGVDLFIKKGNTGAATLTLITKTGTLLTKAIKKSNGDALSSGDIKDSTSITLTYYSGAWRCDPTGNAGSINVSDSAWSLLGNSGTVDGTNFIGTTDNIPFNIRVNNLESGRIESSATANTFFGFRAGEGNLAAGAFNTAFGYKALLTNTIGGSNVAIGYNSLFSNINGGSNIGIGGNALTTNNVGGANIGVGVDALRFNTTASSNTAVGYLSLRATTTGGNNTAVGESALITNTVGTENTSLGYSSNVGSNNLNNATAIGAYAMVSDDSCLVLGNAANVGIGISAPTEKLHVIGNGLFSGHLAAGSGASINDKRVLNIVENIGTVTSGYLYGGFFDLTYSGQGATGRNPVGLIVTTHGQHTTSPNILNIAGNFYCSHESALATTELTGVQSSISTTGAGAVTRARTFCALAPSISSADPATIVGLCVENHGNSGTTNSYGINIDAQSGSTNNYGIVSAAAQNGFGTITPSQVVDVVGNVEVNGQVFIPPTALTYTTAITWNLNTSAVATLSLTASTATITPSNVKAGGTYNIEITQGGVGSFTMAWASTFKFPSGILPTLTTTVGAKDIFQFVSFNGTNLMMVSGSFDVK